MEGLLCILTLSEISRKLERYTCMTKAANIGYDRNLVPRTYRLASGALDRAAILGLYYQRLPKGQTMPAWFSSDTRSGRLVHRMIFCHVLREEWKIVMDSKTRNVDPRLQRREQEALLKELCGEGNWGKLLDKWKLRKGSEHIHNDRILLAFREYFPWAFDPETKNHLHDNDFFYIGMYAEVEVGGRIWDLVDHILRIDLGITLYDPATGTIDRRITTQKGRTEIAKSKGYQNWSDLEERTGLAMVLSSSPVALGIEGRKGDLGFLLKWYCPEAFSPELVNHLDVREFIDRPINYLEKRALLLEIASAQRVPTLLISALISPDQAADLLNPGQTMVELVEECFTAEIERGTFAKECLYTRITIEGGKAKFRAGGKDYALEGLSPASLYARREAPEYIVVYERARRQILKAGEKNFCVIPRHVLMAKPAGEITQIRDYDEHIFPPYESQQRLAAQLLKQAPPIVMQRIPFEIQNSATNFFSARNDIAVVVDYINRVTATAGTSPDDKRIAGD